MTRLHITRRPTALLAALFGVLPYGLACAPQPAAAQAGPAPDIKIVGVAPDRPGFAGDANLRAGAAAVDITPPRTMWDVMMAGYFDPKQIPQGVHDPLRAKALVLDNGTVRLCIVTTDLISVPVNLRNATLAKLSPSARLAPERVLMCASHTHSGPGGLTEMKFAAQFLGGFRPAMADYVAGRIAAAINAAAANLRPAKWGYASANFSDFTHNRRGNKTVNPRVSVVRVDGTNGKPIALLVNFGTHPIFLEENNRLFSADFVGYMLAAIERARGGVALFANSALGDQNPDQDEKLAAGYPRAEAYGKRMALEALRLARAAHMRGPVALAGILGELKLPAPTVPVETRQVPIMAMRIGDVLLLGVPGEPAAEIGLDIENRARQFAFDLPMVVGLANDEIAYILSRDDYKRGGYEAEMSFFGSDLGPTIVAGVTELASRIQPMAQAFGALPAAAPALAVPAPRTCCMAGAQ